MMRRLRRLRLLTAEIYQQTGNPLKALSFAVRYIVAKLPILIQQPRAAAQQRTIAEGVRAARRASPPGVPHLAIKITGGLGDALVIARFMRDLVQQCGPLNFDIFVLHPERAQWIFSVVEGLHACHHEVVFDFVMQEYDAAFRINQFVVVHDNILRWHDLRAYPRLVRVLAAMIRFRPSIDTFVGCYPHMDNFLAQKAIYANRTRADYLHLMGGLTYGGDRQALAADIAAPEKFGVRGCIYATINNGFDPDFVISGDRATKCYPYFGAVVHLLRARWPRLCFVQVGSRRSELLEGVDVDLVGRTSLSEVAGVIAGAVLHIDNEGGLVHMARSLGVASAVVFGPTPAAYFGYASNINIEPPFCGGCWWIKGTWMDHCPRGFAEARCMTEQKPSLVADRISAYLSEAGIFADAGTVSAEVAAIRLVAGGNCSRASRE